MNGFGVDQAFTVRKPGRHAFGRLMARTVIATMLFGLVPEPVWAHAVSDPSWLLPARPAWALPPADPILDGLNKQDRMTNPGVPRLREVKVASLGDVRPLLAQSSPTQFTRSHSYPAGWNLVSV